MTNKALFQFDVEINHWLDTGSILALFHRSKIKEFYNNNGIRLHTLKESIETIYHKYIVYENIDNKQVIKFTGEGKDKKPVILDGMNETDFDNELNELMNREITIIL